MRGTAPRAALFVPADRGDRIAKAARSGAQAIVLDLEDAIPPDRKCAARAGLAAALEALPSTPRVFVRVNPGLDLLASDVEEALHPRVEAILLPKATCPKVTNWIASQLRAMRPDIDLVALIESPSALGALGEIARCHEAVVGLAFGPEDFCAVAGLATVPQALTLPAQMIALAAKGAGRFALGYPSTIANFQDLGRLTTDMRRGKVIGFDGALVIHPAQLKIAQTVFGPSREELDWAEKIVSGFKPEEGVAQIDGAMVDAPVYERARRLLAGSDQVAPSG